MVRALFVIPIGSRRQLARTGCALQTRAARRLLILGTLTLCSGCAIVPRSQMDECQRLSQTLRSENARLRDQVLSLQNQNRDYADRAVDDSRRLSVQDEAIERLERSVQAYQDERARLESAYKQLTSNLDVTGSRPEAPPARNRSALPQADESRPPPLARGSKSRKAGPDDPPPR
jgi:hypothetical protein